MKSQPEIDPEIRGLLEEIVADPRSCVRLVPRKPLKHWFESGETVRERELSGTKAERHLIAAHREALAKLLYEASRIALYKSGALLHRYNDQNARVFDETYEDAWRERARRRAHSQLVPESLTALLRECLNEIQANNGWALALSSLAVAPDDRTRSLAAAHVPSDRPRTAIRLLRRVARTARARSIRSMVLTWIGIRKWELGDLEGSRQSYEAAGVEASQSPLDRFCVFNLSCYLGDRRRAQSVAEELRTLVAQDDTRLTEGRDLLRVAHRRHTRPQRSAARAMAMQVAQAVGGPVEVLCEAFDQ